LVIGQIPKVEYKLDKNMCTIKRKSCLNYNNSMEQRVSIDCDYFLGFYKFQQDRTLILEILSTPWLIFQWC